MEKTITTNPITTGPASSHRPALIDLPTPDCPSTLHPRQLSQAAKPAITIVGRYSRLPPPRAGASPVTVPSRPSTLPSCLTTPTPVSSHGRICRLGAASCLGAVPCLGAVSCLGAVPSFSAVSCPGAPDGLTRYAGPARCPGTHVFVNGHEPTQVHDPASRQLVAGGGRPSWLRITRTASSTGALAAVSRRSYPRSWRREVEAAAATVSRARAWFTLTSWRATVFVGGGSGRARRCQSNSRSVVAASRRSALAAARLLRSGPSRPSKSCSRRWFAGRAIARYLRAAIFSCAGLAACPVGVAAVCACPWA